MCILRAPLKPEVPEAQQIVFPKISLIVIIMLLNVFILQSQLKRIFFAFFLF
jgi:membrane protein required for beta-lactamase induction